MSDHARVRNYMVRAYVVKVKEAYVAGAGCSGYMRFKGEIAKSYRTITTLLEAEKPLPFVARKK